MSMDNGSGLSKGFYFARRITRGDVSKEALVLALEAY